MLEGIYIVGGTTVLDEASESAAVFNHCAKYHCPLVVCSPLKRGCQSSRVLTADCQPMHVAFCADKVRRFWSVRPISTLEVFALLNPDPNPEFASQKNPFKAIDHVSLWEIAGELQVIYQNDSAWTCFEDSEESRDLEAMARGTVALQVVAG